eukprot:6186599-Pleurochrysis_carterae.AAC.1
MGDHALSPVPANQSPYVLLGVMSNPSKPALRTQWRSWAQHFDTLQDAVGVRFVLGKYIYEKGSSTGKSTAVSKRDAQGPLHNMHPFLFSLLLAYPIQLPSSLHPP